MDNQNKQQYTVPKHHKNVLYAAVGCALLAVVLLVVVLIGMMKHSQNQQTSQVAQVQQSTTTPSPTQENQTAQTAVIPMPINNASDVNKALQQVNNTDPSSVSTSLNQNTSDASQFSQ